MKRAMALLIVLFSSVTFSLPSYEEGFLSLVDNALEQPAPIAHAVSINNPELVKFLIDSGEDVNLATPAIPAFWVSDEAEIKIQVADQPGKTPLDIAIESQSREMVEILLYYHPTHRAHHDYTVWRHYGSFNHYGYFQTYYKGGYDYSTTPLSEAIKRKDDDIVKLILKAFQSQQRLDDYFYEIRISKRPELMRAWIAQIMLVWKNEVVDIPDEMVRLYTYASAKKALRLYGVETFKTLVRLGALVTQACFQDVLETKDYLLISFVRSEARFDPSFDPVNMWEAYHWNSF